MTEDKLIERVRKLLKKAEGAATEHEAEAYTAKATELMMKHSIDEAVLSARGAESTEAVVARTFTVKGYAKAKLELLRQVARGLGCDAAFYSNDRRGWSEGRAEVIGWESDIEALEVLFASLQLQAASEAKRELVRVRREFPQMQEAYLASQEAQQEWEQELWAHMREHVYGKRMAGEDVSYLDESRIRREWRAAHPAPEAVPWPGQEAPHGRAFMQSFLIGYAAIVGDRLRKQRAEAVKVAEVDLPGTALAVRDRGAAVKELAEKRWTYGGSSRQGAQSSSNTGYYSGRAAGSRADLGGSRTVGGGRRAIGGGR